jgi:hypothetical protein
MAKEKREKDNEMVESEQKKKSRGERYEADSITVLEGREAVRMRPAMYIGSNW